MSSLENDPDLPRRGALGILMLVVPVVSVVLVGAAYVWMAWLGAGGRPASGPVVDVVFRGCPEAQAVVAERVAFMGLADPTFAPQPDGFRLSARFPAEERVIAAIPVTLAATGALVVRAGDDGEVLATEADVVDATVVPTFLDVPRAQAQLGLEPGKRLKAHMGAHIDAHISAWLDGDLVTRRKNAPPIDDGQVDLDLPELPAERRIDRAAHAAAVLAHGPLPCPVQVASVERRP